MASPQGEKQVSTTTNDRSLISRVSRSVSQSPILHQTKRADSDAAFVSNRLIRSTGRAAWIAGTTFLTLVVPLIIEMDREQQLNDLELQQANNIDTFREMVVF